MRMLKNKIFMALTQHGVYLLLGTLNLDDQLYEGCALAILLQALGTSCLHLGDSQILLFS